MDDPLERFFDRRYVPQWLVGGGVLLLVISAFVWWTQVYENPYNVYWDMFANSLKVSSVTKHVTETSGGTELNQYITLDFGTSNLAYGRTVLKDTASTVTTESIGTLTSDYVRYTGITTSQKDSKGRRLRFASVLDKWAKAPAANTSDQSVSAPFFVQVLLGFSGGNLVPMADLPVQARQSLVQQLHQNVIFNTSFHDVKIQKVGGRTAYVYSVAIEPVAYVAFEKNVATDLGLKALQNVDPNNYEGQPAVHVTFSIDVRSHRLVAIGYPGTNHTETYDSYGVPARVTIPAATISDAKLQSLLGAIQ